MNTDRGTQNDVTTLARSIDAICDGSSDDNDFCQRLNEFVWNFYRDPNYDDTEIEWDRIEGWFVRLITSKPTALHESDMQQLLEAMKLSDGCGRYPIQVVIYEESTRFSYTPEKPKANGQSNNED